MSKITSEKKANIITMAAPIEDVTEINRLHSLMSECKNNTEIPEVKISATQDIVRTEREEAARIFDGELYNIEKAIKKITSLDNYIFDDYFCKYDGHKKEDCEGIAWEFNRIGAFIEIIFDNVYDIRKTLEEIRGGNEE